MLRAILFFFVFGIYIQASAQKKTLDPTAFDSWQRIGESLISPDGHWVVYSVMPQEGDNELFIRSGDGSFSRTIQRGYNAMITDDSRFLVCRIKPLFRDTREARLKKKKPDEFPKDSLAVIELGKDEIWKRPMVRNFKMPGNPVNWLAYQLEKGPSVSAKPGTKEKTTGRVTDSLNRVIDSLKNLLENQPKRKKNKKRDESDYMPGEETGNADPGMSGDYPESDDAEGDESGSNTAETAYDLVVRDLSTGNEKVYERVLEYYFSKTGNKLLFEQAGDSASPRKAIYCDLGSGQLTVLSTGGNDFRSFTLSDDGSQVAYVAEREAGKKDLVKYYKLWYYRTGMDSAEWVVDKNTVGMRLGMTVSEYGNIRFSRSGRRLFFGSAPVPVPRDTTIIEMDMPNLDVWHYKDDYLQPMQKVPARLQAARQENYLSMLDLDSRRVRQLGSREIPNVLLTDEGDGDMFVGISDFGKRIESQWLSSSLTDIYSIDVNTGFKMLVKENLQGSVYPSPGGRYIMWYDQKAREYFAWDGHRVKNLTEKIRPALWNEEFDMPDHPSNYGIMGWHAGDSAVYVYDRFDVWAIDLATGANPRIITRNGRSDKTRYRYIRLDNEERFISSDKPAFFSYFREDTKQAGLLMGRIGEMSANLSTLTGGEYSFGPVRKAKQAPQLIFTKENFTQPPDIYLLDAMPGPVDGNPSLALPNRETRLSSINPQQADYLWGTAELFKWKAYNGRNATGIVYKPDHFDPKKRYPVIVYFYEKLSQNLFDYKDPGPIRSEVNVSCMVSNGYIVFIPDIEYRIGFPGQSAYDYVVSGARALVKRGWADSTRMAIQGHSWGGYQAAQLATMTNLFRAVWAGAPVSNMTSAYGGIRWESGRNRQFQYEKSQSRIGATLWERPDLYIRNSPLFHLDKVTAPMVILHNDEDGAVPWYQGIELFTGLRRLGKPVWLLNYNGQGHGLSQRKDMKDYYIRMKQFFDYMLKGARPARWITEGVPAVRKGKDWGLELD